MSQPSIRVTPVVDSLQDALLALAVQADQRGYVGAIENLLADVAQCPQAEPMAICLGHTPIGFYRIDPHPRSVAGRDFELPALGLRGFFIDARWQGRGFGTQALAALLVDVGTRHVAARLLVLSVNVRNLAATALYERAGFIDTGELYHGGSAGPQRLLRRALP